MLITEIENTAAAERPMGTAPSSVARLAMETPAAAKPGALWRGCLGWAVGLAVTLGGALGLVLALARSDALVIGLVLGVLTVGLVVGAKRM